ncbi:hypothetical protein [Corynebacterium sp. LK2510]|uniref:hypothetical protein n=1 Tax=Corynebacterium sp. LK2510 TaxID=3110472 RepID=UPI0034CF6372
MIVILEPHHCLDDLRDVVGMRFSTYFLHWKALEGPKRRAQLKKAVCASLE